MADLQIQQILESMMTLKKIDSNRASRFMEEASSDSDRDDAIFCRIMMETVSQ